MVNMIKYDAYIEIITDLIKAGLKLSSVETSNSSTVSFLKNERECNRNESIRYI